MTISLDAIRAVRAVVERSIPEVRAALEATGGDVEAAIERLITPLEKAANRWARLTANVHSAPAGRAPPPPPPPPADERDIAGVLADFETAARARGLWIGEPDVTGVAALAARHRPPASYVQFLERFNGVDDNIAARLWPADYRRDELDSYDEPGLDDAFPIGKHDDLGYLFLRRDETVWFFDYSDPPPLTAISHNFESFLRDWIALGLNLLDVIHARRR